MADGLARHPFVPADVEGYADFCMHVADPEECADPCGWPAADHVMRSLIILEVQHGQDTDRLQHMITHIQSEYDDDMSSRYPGRPVIVDYHVRVDVPGWYVVRSWENPPKEK